MLKPRPQPDWPAVWHSAFACDLIEFFGEARRAPGYACAYQNRFWKLIEMVEARLPKPSRIIDIAAAQGNFSLTLAEHGYKVTWNDLQTDLLGYVQRKYEFGDIAFVGGNAFELESGGFDGAVITEVIEHVAHPDAFLNHVATLVRPGGFIFMTTPNGGYIRNKLPRFSDCADPSQFEAVQFKPDADGHIFLLHADEVPVLAAAAGLEVVELKLFTNPLTAGHVKLNLLHRLLPQSAILKLEEMTQTASTNPLARKMLIQMAVCFRKPEAKVAPQPTEVRDLASLSLL